MNPCIWREPSHQIVSAAPASFGPEEVLMLTAGLIFHIPAIEFVRQGTSGFGMKGRRASWRSIVRLRVFYGAFAGAPGGSRERRVNLQPARRVSRWSQKPSLLA